MKLILFLFLSSVLGVNRILFVVIPDESTYSVFSKPFEEKDSFTRPKFLAGF